MFFRFLLLGIVLLAPLGGCWDDSSELQTEDNPNRDPGAPEMDGAGLGDNIGCEVSSDCVLAASTCCGCPTFGVPAGQGYDAGCEEVNCEPTGLCPAVEAICDAGQCLLVCSPLVADKVCTFGFVADEAGCLQNECAGAPMDANVECEQDADCVQVPADCCGCGQGGSDTAVPEALVDEQAALLGCPINPACPGLDVCNAEESAQCISGYCALAPVVDDAFPPSAEGSTLCGTPDLPACATGFDCVLNDISANDAAQLGVGSCVMQ